MSHLKKSIFTSTIALVASLGQACNLYDAAYPDMTYLCAGETCTIEGDSSLECQSGCCKDGVCNADGACAKKQAWLSIVAIVAIFIVGVAVFFVY